MYLIALLGSPNKFYISLTFFYPPFTDAWMKPFSFVASAVVEILETKREIIKLVHLKKLCLFMKIDQGISGSVPMEKQVVTIPDRQLENPFEILLQKIDFRVTILVRSLKKKQGNYGFITGGELCFYV